MTRPFVRWVGGKRKLADRICKLIEPNLKRRYVEPFLGGGAVAIELAQRVDVKHSFVLGDTNAALIDTWRWVVSAPASVSRELSRLVKAGVTSDDYYRVRASFNANKSKLGRSSEFIYLNALNYNGLYRVNASGGYNVPKGRQASSYFATPEHLTSIADLFTRRNTHFQIASALSLIIDAGRGDVIYADPPYDDVFGDYTAIGFDLDDQRALALELKAAHDRGVFIVASNNDTPAVRTLYAWANIIELNEARSVSQDIEGRQKTPCLLIVSPGGPL